MSQQSNVNQTVKLANAVGKIGCLVALVALVVIAISFGIGYLIDSWMGNERQWATIILMLASFPVTLYAIVQISLRVMARVQAEDEQLKRSKIAQEDNLKE